MTNLTFSRLDSKNRTLKGFSCGDQAIDRKLNSQLKYVDNYLICLHGIYEGKVLAGVFTIEACTLKGPVDVNYKLSGTGKPISTLHLEVVAIRKSKQGRGLGKILMDYAIAIGIEMSEKVGIKTVSLESAPSSIDFYQKLGFDRAAQPWDDGSLPMWIVLK